MIAHYEQELENGMSRCEKKRKREKGRKSNMRIRTYTHKRKMDVGEDGEN